MYIITKYNSSPQCLKHWVSFMISYNIVILNLEYKYRSLKHCQLFYLIGPTSPWTYKRDSDWTSTHNLTIKTIINNLAFTWTQDYQVLHHWKSSLYERESTIYNSNNPFLKDSSSEAYISIVLKKVRNLLTQKLHSSYR